MKALLVSDHCQQAKGYPDLATRAFLGMIQSIRPELDIFCLADFDPDGIAIMRTYKYGSRGLRHEQNVRIPRLNWLGIQSSDVLKRSRAENGDTSSRSRSSLSHVANDHGEPIRSQPSLKPANEK